MRAGIASKTALGVAMRRAAHQMLDKPLVFEDPLAIRIIGGAERLDLQRGARMRTLRAFLAVRSRYAEDELGAFVAAGGAQLVVLGAGLDTFAYRNPYTSQLKVFEVDHPDTQDWKKGRLRAAGVSIPEPVTYVPVDFERQELADELQNAHGFDSAKKTFFSWLGVTPYLTREALVATLKCIVGMPEGSGVVFDYAVPPASLNLADKIRLKVLARRVAMAGEEFRLFLEPQALAGMLHQIGFSRLEDLGKQELNARYFENRSDGLKINSAIGRLVGTGK